MHRRSRPLLPALLAALVLLPGLARSEEPPPLKPEGRGVASADRSFDIRHLELDLTIDPAGTVSGTATHTLSPLRAGLQTLRLHAVGLDVQSVTLDGAPTTVRTVGEQLHVALPSPSTPGAEHVLAITYTARPQLGLHFRQPGPDSPNDYVEVWSQGEDVDNRHWFPTWDAPDDRFTYTGHFTVPDRLTAISNGRLLDRTPARPGWTRWSYSLGELDLVSYLVMFAAAEYRMVTESWRGKPLITYVPPGTSDEQTRLATGRTAEMLDFMSSATGVEYPYPGYTQVFVQGFLYTGMENTSATVMERLLLHPEGMAPHNGWTERVVAHELAHQWFGDQLTCRDWRHMWLNEGITTFMQSWWTLYAHGPEGGAENLHRSLLRASKDDGQGKNPMVSDFFTLSGAGGGGVYHRGAWVMWMLKALLGDEDFGRGFRLYTQRHQHGLVSTHDLQEAFEDATGLQLDWFFQQWAYFAGNPVVEVKHTWEDGSLRVDLTQVQTVGGMVPLFTLFVDLDVADATGAVTRHRLWMDGETASLVLPMQAPPAFVALDPQAGVLGRFRQTQSDAEWTALLTGSATAWSKRLAWAALAEREGPIEPALRQVVEGTLLDAAAHPVWRRTAAQTLGAWNDEASIDVLADALGRLGGREGDGAPGIATDVRLQSAIAGALAEAAPGGVAEAALRTLHQRGADEVVRGDALESLGKVLGVDAVPLARAALQGPPGHNAAAWRYAWGILGAHGEARDLERLARFRAPDQIYWVAAGALRASASIANRQERGRDRDEAREQVARDAERLLDASNLRMVQVAISVLGLVGDSASVARLDALRAASTVDVVRKASTRSIEAIRTRKEVDPEKPEDDGALTAKVKALEEALEELTKELRELQEMR